jgi:hypothetical protein
MKSNLVKIDFTTPTVLNMDNTVSLRDIHSQLKVKGGVKPNSQFRVWVKKKLEHYTQGVDFTTDEILSPDETGTYGDGPIEYYTPIQIGMEILANGHGKVGHEMRQWLSGCARKVVENQLPIPTDSKGIISLMKMATAELEKVHGQLLTEQSEHGQTKLMLVKATDSVSRAADIVTQLSSTVQAYEATPIETLISMTMESYDVLQEPKRYPNLIAEAKRLHKSGTLKNYCLTGVITLVLISHGCQTVKVRSKEDGIYRSQYNRADIDKAEATLTKRLA